MTDPSTKISISLRRWGDMFSHRAKNLGTFKISTHSVYNINYFIFLPITTSLSWCMLLDPPIIPSNPNAKILTNSAKYAHYGTGLTNRRLRFGSMNQCIEVAKSGKMNLMNGNSDGLPHWLRSCTQRLVRSIKFVK